MNKNNKGFTIIEVLIVLAIAALIMLIVFLAVPSLQRNSRNSSRRSDVSRMLGGLSEARANNFGAMPGTTGNPPAQVTDKLNFYIASDVNYTVNATAPSAPTSMDTNKVYVANYLKCATIPAAASSSTTFNISGMLTTVAASARTAVAYYAVETTGANVQPQCLGD